MAIPIDSISYRKLVVVKQLYQQAIELSEPRNNIVSKIMAVIGFDLSIETMLKAVVSSIDTSKTPSDGGLNALIQQTTTVLSKAALGTIPDEGNIRRVHSIRNDAQHKARYPNDTDLSDCHTYTKDFLQKIITQVWDANFDKISLIELVKDEKIKDFLTKAEEALSQNDYIDAIRYAGGALHITMMIVRDDILGRIPSYSGHIITSNVFGDLSGEHETRQMHQVFVNMHNILIYTVLGLNYAEYMRYRQIVPEVLIRGDGEPILTGRPPARVTSEWDRNDAEFTLAYCTNTIIRIEERVGDINEPFGGMNLLV